MYNLDGNFSGRFGRRGRRRGDILRPTGICCLPNGILAVAPGARYAVADYENRSVTIYDSSFRAMSCFGQNKLLGPKGLLYLAEKRQFLVVDNKANAIIMFQVGDVGNTSSVDKPRSKVPPINFVHRLGSVRQNDS